MARKFKFGMFEAYPSEDGTHVRDLVTDKDGAVVGVKLRDIPQEDRKDLDRVARYEPQIRVKRMSNELIRAVDKKMIKQHLPPGVPVGGSPWVVASNIVEAIAIFKPPKPKPKTKPHKKQKPAHQSERPE